MTPNDKYLRLLTDAQEALFALLRASEPNTGATLRDAWGELMRLRGQRLQTATAHDSRWVEGQLRERVWKTKPAAECEHIVLSAIADDHWTIRELVYEINHHSDFRVDDRDVRPVIRGLLDAGEIVRVNVEMNGSVRYRYSRNVLSGPIADLEHAFERGES